MRSSAFVRPTLLVAGALLASATLAACDSAEADPAVSTTEAEYVVEDAAAEQANGDQAAVAPDLPDACGLLSAAVVAESTGEAFDEGEFNAILSTDSLAVCDWYASSGESYSTVQVQVAAYDGDFDAILALAATNYGDTSDVTVPGAEQAFTAQNGTVVTFVAGDIEVTVLHYIDEWVDLTDVTTALATAAASSL